MKEFIDKLISRLENHMAYCKTCHEEFPNAKMSLTYEVQINAYKNAIEIVNQLAEEYKDKVIIDGQYCFQTCGATEHCKECNRLSNGSIDYYENYDCLAEEYNNGWIPISEKLPKPGRRYLVSAVWEDGDYTKPAVYSAVFGGDGLWHTFNFEPVLYDVIAWCELPAPYQPKK